jgi:hypothetical protein
MSARSVGAILCASAFLPVASAQDLLPEKSVSVRNRPRPEYEAPGIRMGTFQLSPRLTVGSSRDDNVFATDTDQIEDRVTVLGGNVRLRSREGRVPMSVYGDFDSQSYSDNPLEDYVDRTGGASIGFNFARRTTVSLGGDYALTHQSRGEPSFPAAAIERPRFETGTALLDIAHDFASGRLNLSAERESINFDDALLAGGTTIDQDFRDRDTHTVEVQGNIVVGESLAALVRAVQVQRDYDLDTVAGEIDRNSTSTALFGGVALDVTNLMSGEVAIGALELDNRDPEQSDTRSVAVSSSLELYMTQLMTATVDVQRTSAAADIEGSASYIGTSVSIGLDYELRRNLILSAAVARSRREYTDLDRRDNNKRASISAQWLVNRRMNVVLDYSHIERRWLVDAGLNYRQRVLSANVNFAL